MKATHWLAFIALWIVSNAQSVARSGLHFELNGSPFTFAGANTWESLSSRASKRFKRLMWSSRIL